MNSILDNVKVWAKQHYGIALHKHQLGRIEKSLEKLKSSNCYSNDKLSKLIQDNDQEIIKKLVDMITVQESYFFRDKSFFNLLKEVYLPELIKEKIANNDLSLRVWSAGCSRGEEIYSIAILLDQLIPNISPWKIKLLGTDINELAVKVATSGIYTQSSLRAIDAYNKENYFTEKGGRYYLNEAIKKRVSFDTQNLSGNDRPNETFDFITCRNVFIYLSNHAIEHALGKFETCLKRNGRLFLGSSDFVSSVRHDLSMQFAEGVAYFIHKNIAPEVKEIRPVFPPKRSFLSRQKESADKLDKIKEALKDDPELALRLIDKSISKPTALLYQYKAQALIRMNDVITANEACESALTLDAMNYPCLLLKGLIHLEKDELDLARHHFHKAIIAKPEPIEAAYYLARLDISENKKPEAIKYLKKALVFAKDKPKEKSILDFEHNTTLSEFIRGIQSELSRLERSIHDK